VVLGFGIAAELGHEPEEASFRPSGSSASARNAASVDAVGVVAVDH